MLTQFGEDVGGSGEFAPARANRGNVSSADQHRTTAQPHIRPFRDADLADLYDVCVRTADGGGDARGHYDTDELMGDIFAAPYAVLEPALTFVLEDGGRVVGYILGTADTERFAGSYRDRWIPQRADRYPPLDRDPVTPTERMISLHQHPERMILPALAGYPAHLHIDLLPAYQRRGYGRALMDRLLSALAAAGAPGVHLVVLTANTAALAFYARLGFSQLNVPDLDEVTVLGRTTAGGC